MIKLATVFSGIGAPEEALKQLNKEFETVFACDNGERELDLTYDEIMEQTKEMTYEQRLEFVNDLYKETGKENYVKKSYFANLNNINTAFDLKAVFFKFLQFIFNKFPEIY